MSELSDLASALVDRAGSGEQVEAFLTHQRDFEVKAYMGAAETVSSAEPRGAGVRLRSQDRVGFAYTTDLSETGLSAVVEQARTNARFSSEDDAVTFAAATAYEEVPGLLDERQPGVPPEDKVAFAVRLEEATRSIDKRIRTVEEAGYSDSDTEIAIATSTGASGSYRRTDAWCYSVAIAAEGDDTQVGFEFDLGRGLGSLDAEDVARRSAERALGVLGATKIASARMPVVFDPYTSAQFLGVIGRVLTAEAVQKGRSLFAGKLGEVVAADALTLVDDGRAEGAPGASPWDAEGTPTQRTEIIRDGVLASLLYDIPSAKREGRASTGNASRAGFKSAPGPSPTNMAFVSTGETMEEVLRKGGRALLVQDFHGVHSGANPVSGDFSVGATGRLLQDGAVGAPVKEVTIAAPMLEILRGIVAVANDRRWLPFGGSYGGATTLVAEMTVGGL
jgi:PmbA protein